MFDLLYAAAVGDLPSVKHCVLRSRKANFLWGDLTRTCCRGRTAIQYAVLGGHAVVVAELIQAGAQLNNQDKDGTTCLMMAAERGNAETLDLLLQYGADVHITARDGSTAAHCAARHGHMECLQSLLRTGSSVIAIDCLGRMLIHWAAQSGHIKMIEMLLDQGCPVNGGTCHVNGETPLHVAVKYGHVDAVKFLLFKRASVNAVMKDGSTPLHICCTSDLAHASAFREIGAILLSQKKIHVEASDACGKSALAYSKDFSMKSMILCTLQGRPPAPESSEFQPESAEVIPKSALLKPVTASPHPLIPGHKWPEQDSPLDEVKTSPQERCGRNIQSGSQCPYAVDSSDHQWHGTEYRARQLEHEGLIWEAATVKDKAHSRCTDKHRRLIPSDCMWFDSGSQRILEKFPARQYLGRYRS